MLKSTTFVALFLQLLLQTECLYPGERCIVDDQNGRCIPIPQCQHIVEEIQMAGSPMPMHIRIKLGEITCGYASRDPMVCCVPPSPPSTPGWSSLENSSEATDRPDRDGNINQNYDSNNSVGSNENVEAFTRATVQNKFSPIPVENHPNLHLLPLNCGNIESNRIWGGNRTSLYEMPWMVLLSYYDSGRGTKLSCGGSLITEWYVLTAAHCVEFLGNRLHLNGVILGEYDVRHDPDCEISGDKEYCAPKVENITIDSVVAHPGYTPQSLIDDIALIRLSRPADFSLSSMKPLCLPITQKLQDESLVGDFAVVAGWGVTEDGLQSPVLLSVDLPVVSQKDCQAAYKGTVEIRNTQICAGGVKDKDSCGGDSGGPLMYPGELGTHGVRYIQRGLVSFGPKRCGIGGYPGVYTNVAYYMKWILDHIHS